MTVNEQLGYSIKWETECILIIHTSAFLEFLKKKKNIEMYTYFLISRKIKMYCIMRLRKLAIKVSVQQIIEKKIILNH